jgi:hypothetical protein
MRDLNQGPRLHPRGRSQRPDLGRVRAGQRPRARAAGRDGRHERGARLSARRAPSRTSWAMSPRCRTRTSRRCATQGKEPDPILLHPGFRIGKQGIEKALDAELRGTPGGRASRSTPGAPDPGQRGGPRVLEPLPGKDVVLTTGRPTSRTARWRCSGTGRAARPLLMDSRNGDIRVHGLVARVRSEPVRGRSARADLQAAERVRAASRCSTSAITWHLSARIDLQDVHVLAGSARGSQRPSGA